MNKKKLFGVLAAASMILNSGVAVFAEEMVEASGVLGAVTNPDGSIAINAQNFPDEDLLAAVKAAAEADDTTDATKVTSLSLSKNQVENFAGLQYLTGLTSLTIENNTNLADLDLSTNTALKTLTVSNNPGLVSITLPTTEELGTISITGNKSLTELDLSPASLATNADLSNNALAKLNVANNLHLLDLDVHGNVLYALDTTNCRHLINICAAGNRIYEIDITSRAVETLDLAGNKLTTLDTSEMVNLTELNVADNMLESIQLPQENNLTYFNCDQNHLASLDLSDVMKNTEASGVTVITGTQSLFAGTEDKAIDLKAYDADFDPNNTNILDENGNQTGKKIAKNGVADLADEGSDIPDNPNNPGGPSVTPPGPENPPEKTYNLTAENTEVTYKAAAEAGGEMEAEAKELTAEDVTVYYSVADNEQETPVSISVKKADGSGSTVLDIDTQGVANLTVTYTAPGTYTVTISADNTNGIGNAAFEGYAQNSAKEAVELTGVKGVALITLTPENTRILAEGTPLALVAVQYSPDGGKTWTIVGSKTDFASTQVTAVGTPTALKGTVPAGYVALDSTNGLADVPVVSTSVLPEVKPNDLRILYPMTLSNGIEQTTSTGSAYVQLKNPDGTWTTIATTDSATTPNQNVSAGVWSALSSTPSGDEQKLGVKDIKNGTGTVTAAATDNVSLAPFGYSLPAAVAGNIASGNSGEISNVPAQPIVDLTVKNTRLLYTVTESGGFKATELQVYTGTGTADPTVDTGWKTVEGVEFGTKKVGTLTPAINGAKYATVLLEAKDVNSTINVVEKGISVTNKEYNAATTLETAVTIPAILDTADPAAAQYIITSITIDDNGTAVSVPEGDLGNFSLSAVDTEKNTGTLSYTSDATDDIKKTYVIDGG
ncbi:MAG: hypothetical protein K2H85_03325, partial [Allobaculum sp.]|nr:hypothetical protein [Allobaculum sp.]